jgi:hypothetical protein
MYHLLQVRCERWLLIGEWFELEEQRVDDKRLQEKDDQPDWQRRNPEIQPPMPLITDDGVQDPYGDRAEDDRQNFSYNPISEPRDPTLNRDTVFE